MSPSMIVGAFVAAIVASAWYVKEYNALAELPSFLQPVTVTAEWSSLMIGDKIETFCNAVAFAEGYHDENRNPIPHNLAYRSCNPGDLKWTPARFMAHVVGKTPNGILIFESHDWGWMALRHQVEVMFTGRSDVYSTGDSLIDVGDKYAKETTNDPGGGRWSRNVARFLGVDPGVTIAELAV